MPSPEQVPAAQTVPTTNERQAPAPSQVPSRPQEDSVPLTQSLALLGFTPAGTAAHVPGEPGRLHAMHLPLQAVLQQNPLPQNPLAQSVSHAHARPRPVFPLGAPAGQLAPVPESGVLSTATSGTDPPSLFPTAPPVPVGFCMGAPPPQPATNNVATRQLKASTETRFDCMRDPPEKPRTELKNGSR